MGFVKVATDIGSANGDVMELPLEGDQTLSLTTLTASFPEACGLKYKSSSGFTRGIRCVNGCFYPPSTDGWGSAVYLCIFKASEGSPSLTPLTTKRANPFQSMYGSKNEWIVKKNKTEAMLSSASAAGPSDTVTKKKNEIKNFTRDFVLLQNCTIPKTPLSDNAFDALGAEGLVFRGIKFTTAMSDVDVVKQINKALEASKLGKSIDFTLINTKLKKMDHFHVAKNVALLDGQFLFERTSLKYFIYIVPKQNLFDEDNSSKSFSDSDSSDRGVFMSVPKKKFTKTSKTAQKKNLNGSGSDDTNLTGEIIQCYRSNAQNTQRTFVKVNRQEKVLPTLISIISDKEFIFTAKPSVSFISECGVGFGPTKALCSKALNEIRVSDFLEGGDYLKTFIRCEPMLEEFEKYGKICAWSIMHSGITPAFFNRVFVEILLRGSEEALKMNLTLADVANSSIRQELQVVMEAEDVASINSAMADSLLFQYIRTYTRVTRANFEEERTIAVKAALQHCCVKRIADGVKAFGKGFNQYNLLTFLKAQPEAAKDIFCQKIEKIYSKEMLLYQFHISNDDRKTQVYKFLVTYLEKAEGPAPRFSLNNILESITGHVTIPPLGYGECKPTIQVTDTESVRIRECFNRQELPRSADDYDIFEMTFNIALQDVSYTEV